MVEIMVIASMWESMASWCTPTVLFCVTNLIIATIFIASNKHHDHYIHVHADSSSNSFTPISRVSSFLDRARSMNLSSYTAVESPPQYCPPQPKTTSKYSSSSRLAQSIYVTPPELTEPKENPVSQPALVVPVERANSSGELARAPSFLERVKSFKICSAFKTCPNASHNADHHVIRSKSENIMAKKSLVEMKKSRSEANIAMEEDEDEDVDMRRPATTRESRDEFDEEVDAKADDFISRFKQQLKLQRLESLVRYNQMLKRSS